MLSSTVLKTFGGPGHFFKSSTKSGDGLFCSSDFSSIRKLKTKKQTNKLFFQRPPGPPIFSTHRLYRGAPSHVPTMSRSIP